MTRRKSEKAILNETLVALSAMPNTMVWRNNSGMAWQGRERTVRPGQTVVVTQGMVVLEDARPVKFGLVGSGDIMGASHRRPLAVEVKDEAGRQSEAQINFERAWRKVGGIYILARSSEEACQRLSEETLIG